MNDRIANYSKLNFEKTFFPFLYHTYFKKRFDMEHKFPASYSRRATHVSLATIKLINGIYKM